MEHRQSIFLTSNDDWETYEEHICIWSYWPQTWQDPEYWGLISVDGMDVFICPKDLWEAVEDEGPEKWETLTYCEYD
jgi:hypothetical protein